MSPKRNAIFKSPFSRLISLPARRAEAKVIALRCFRIPRSFYRESRGKSIQAEVMGFKIADCSLPMADWSTHIQPEVQQSTVMRLYGTGAVATALKQHNHS
jgi:hypothetical protein